MSKFKLPFDKIYILSYAGNEKRHKEMLETIKYLNAEDITEFIYTTPVSSYLENYFTEKLNYDEYEEDFIIKVASCALNHYTAIKTGYELGYNRILILEDDVKFIENNDSLIQQTFDMITDDYPIIKLMTQVWSLPNFNTLSLFDNNDDGNQEFSNINYDTKTGTAAGYTLNRKGMKLLIDAYNKEMQAADAEFSFIPTENIYITKYLILTCGTYWGKSTISFSNYKFLSDKKFNLPFDKIFVLCYAGDKERYKYMKNTINYINGENISEFIYTTPGPNYIKEYCKDTIFSMKDNGKSDISLRCFSVEFNYYSIIKTSYELGYNRILILEDDVVPIWWNDNLIQETFDLIRDNDYSICKLHTQTHLSFFNNRDDGVQEFTNKDNLSKICRGGCYSLNRKGMELFIEAYNKTLQSSDGEFYFVESKFIYLPKYLIFEENDLSLKSNILIIK